MMKNTKKRFSTILLTAIVVTGLVLPASVWAATHDFGDFLANVGNVAVLDLADNTPREITIEAPKKYIENIEVIHSKSRSVSDVTIATPITNIDVNLKEVTGVSGVRVTVSQGVTDILTNVNMKPLEAGSTGFSVGFATLPDNFDLKIEVLNGAVVIETKVFKVPAESKDVFKIKDDYTYKTAGKDYTLYDLLADENIFADLLSEHSLGVLKYNKVN